MNNVSVLCKEYSIGQSERGRPTIIINRKMSEIPFRLDLELIRAAGSSIFDIGKVTYEFLIPENIEKGEKILARFMWVKKV
jgi:hypothetical protein